MYIRYKMHVCLHHASMCACRHLECYSVNDSITIWSSCCFWFEKSHPILPTFVSEYPCARIFRNNVVHACTCADTSSASEDEGSLRRRQAAVSAVLAQSLQNSEFWINRSIQGSSTSSSASSTLSHGDGSKNHIQNTLADVLAHTRIGTPTLHVLYADKVVTMFWL